MNTDKHRLGVKQAGNIIRVYLRPSVVQPSSKDGSALLMVLAVVVVLAVLITTFGSNMKGEVKAASGHYEEALNAQLARSALALARMELNRKNTALYSDDYGNAFFIKTSEDYESEIEDMMRYRDGLELGRGIASYRLVHKPTALDPNEVTQNDWHRLLEVACGIEEGEERNALVDAFHDWIDPDDLTLANGAEEEVYQELDPPRHVKNAPVSSHEEILLIDGFTPPKCCMATATRFVSKTICLWAAVYSATSSAITVPRGRLRANTSLMACYLQIHRASSTTANASIKLRNGLNSSI